MADYRNPQWLLPNCKNLKLPEAGAITGSGLTEDRHSLYSMDFDGSSYVNIGNPSELQFTSDFSISGWFKTSATSAGRIVSKDNISSGRSWLVQVQADGSVIGVIFASNSAAKVVTSSTGFNDGNWHNFVFTYEEGVGLKLYIDNSTPASLSYTNSPNFNQSANVEIGRAGNGINVFDGQIDEVAIFNTTLTLSEVQALSTANAPANIMALDKKPVAYYPLGEQARDNTEWQFPNQVLQSQVFDFNGTSEVIDINSTIDLGTVHTISFWANISATSFANIVTGLSLIHI